MQNQLKEEYACILEMYMNNFGLESVDISFLSNVNRKTIDAILRGTGGIELGSLEAISRIFDLRYFQFGNPDFGIPSFETLPIKTRNRILLRKKVGPHVDIKYQVRLLNEKIIILLGKLNKGNEFLSTDISQQYFLEFDEKVKTSEVSVRLDSSLTDFVLNISKKDKGKDKGKVKGEAKAGRTPNKYRLVKKIPEDLLASAVKTVQSEVSE